MRPTVSCIVPTGGRPGLLSRAIRYFERSAASQAELVIVEDNRPGPDLSRGETIRHLRIDGHQTVGAKRNLACELARGDLILHWDDDDWYAPWRIRWQTDQLLESGADINGLTSLLYYEPQRQRAWRYAYSGSRQPWVAGNTLCYRKSFWEKHPFPDISVGEDARFVIRAAADLVQVLANDSFIVGIIHDTNVSPKKTEGRYWKTAPVSEVYQLIGDDRARLEETGAPTALVACARGIGDILRVTPLIGALDRLGYVVDVLMQADYPGVAELLDGCPEIRSVLSNASECEGTCYSVACFTYWAAKQRTCIRARRAFVFPRNEWLQHGDSYCVEKIARELGWKGAMPEPFAKPSSRHFDLPPGTVAFHPGCKPDWPWKKWHGFGELASRFPNVAIVGAEDDLNNGETYFHSDFEWPSNVRNFVGKLSLSDTAALLSQCAALISNDSGIMHLAVALGVPAFGIFGITSPAREAIPSPTMMAVTKGLPCEPACREKPWGRRDCEYHLECLRTLTPSEVAAKVMSHLGNQSAATRIERPTVIRQQGQEAGRLRIAYHAHIFDASGYGAAARAYIRALQAAGIELTIRNLSDSAPQVHDELAGSLLDRPLEPDFHLFHGIPAVWAREAFRLSNAIGMTVWETDIMPPQWRSALNHVLQVWLPCDFNVDVFQAELRRKVVKLAHPAPAHSSAQPGKSVELALGVDPDDFVFYSIFEWQERKGPVELLRAFLRAFDGTERAALLIKTNPGACGEARETLEALRRDTGSTARVELRCEAWDDTAIAALHERGDCYVSLHRGEGWGYPLFEAVCYGKPVVATGYSGPMEYLDPASHQLVSWRLGPVQQRYRFYHKGMRWAEPDWKDATARMRAVYSDPVAARARAESAAPAIRERFSMASVGRTARMHLLELLEQVNPPRHAEIVHAERSGRLRPQIPIPPSWFDADYFDGGLKSNWKNGYSWENFRGVFEDTASFLCATCPEAVSYLDAGCAKGFLVRALRAAGKDACGFDISEYALAAADPGTRPHLRLASADAWADDSTYDIVTAFHLLPQLTEEQIKAFLSRARHAARIAIVAVIETCEPGQSAAQFDPGHITLRERAWWHSRFLECGWRQEPLHRAFEQLCQRQELPRRMRWPLFVYAP